MRIETLITAVDAAGYAMVSEEDFPETFDGDAAPVSAASKAPLQALAVWSPVAPSGTGWTSAVQAQASNAWGWIVGRFAGGAAA
jgi:hypothetical protein